MMLQINTHGTWKNVVAFEQNRRAEVEAAVRTLASILGNTASWSLLHEGGRRESLRITGAESRR